MSLATLSCEETYAAYYNALDEGEEALSFAEFMEALWSFYHDSK